MLITLQCVKKFHCGSIRAARRSGSYSLPNAFNNAATSGNNALLVDQTEENFLQVFAVNVKGLFVLLQQELKRMLFQEQGGAIAPRYQRWQVIRCVTQKQGNTDFFRSL